MDSTELCTQGSDAQFIVPRIFCQCLTLERTRRQKARKLATRSTHETVRNYRDADMGGSYSHQPDRELALDPPVPAPPPILLEDHDLDAYDLKVRVASTLSKVFTRGLKLYVVLAVVVAVPSLSPQDCVWFLTGIALSHTASEKDVLTKYAHVMLCLGLCP